jgi:hypothetical protein
MDALDRLMFDVPATKGSPVMAAPEQPKKVVRMIDGVMHDAHNIDIVYCEPPVLHQSCPKCLGSQRLVFYKTKEVKVCFWCTDGRGDISSNDMENYRRRLRLKLEMCYIRTFVPRLPKLILS